MNVATRAVELVEGLRPRVRRRRASYRAVEERIEAQEMSEGAFRCECCGLVKSRFAVGGLAESESRTEVWCLECVERRAEFDRREQRRLAGGRRE